MILNTSTYVGRSFICETYLRYLISAKPAGNELKYLKLLVFYRNLNNLPYFSLP